MSEVEEIAKALAETSKFGTKALDITEKLAKFLSKVFQQPIGTAVGIIGDRLEFQRWERQVRMADQVEFILEKRGVKKFRPIPPKFALPLIENATLEEDDELQDIWIRLMVNGMDPNFKASLRMAYIDIIKGLIPLDVKILDFFYRKLIEDGMVGENFIRHSYTRPSICNLLKLSNEEYLDSINNLFRVQCLTPALIKNAGVGIMGEPLTIFKGTDEISMTTLGKNFIEACIKRD
jgi:hypothetical protein